jgi:hypothetical protein
MVAVSTITCQAGHDKRSGIHPLAAAATHTAAWAVLGISKLASNKDSPAFGCTAGGYRTTTAQCSAVQVTGGAAF